MPKKIMVVDSEQDTIRMIASILSGKGYDVVEACSGAECLRKADIDKPDLILLDTLLPDLSGWELYNRIRRKDKDVKVAFLSAIGLSNERREKLLVHGLSEYIKKPFRSEELVSIVGNILSGDEGAEGEEGGISAPRPFRVLRATRAGTICQIRYRCRSS